MRTDTSRPDAADTTRFVFRQFPRGEAIFSVAELAAVTAHGHTLGSQWGRTGAGTLVTVYGSYLPQRDVDLAQARRDAMACRGRGLGYLFGSVVRVLELVDLDLFEGVRKAPGLAFAAAIRLDADVFDYLRVPENGIAAFLRFRNLDAADNIANRPGVFAIRGVNVTDAADHSWRSGLDRKRAESAARGVVYVKAEGAARAGI